MTIRQGISLFLLFVCGGISMVQAQAPVSCNIPEPGYACEEAPVFCNLEDLNGYCLSMSPIITGNGPNPICQQGGAPHNVHWLSFVAGCEQVNITVIPANCNVVGGQIGLQAAVYRYGLDGLCPESMAMPEEYLVCQSVPCFINPWTLELENLQIGQLYYLVLDGCAGSICEVTFEVSSCAAPVIGSWPGDLSGPATVCSGNTAKYSVPRPSGAFSFHWFVDGEEVEVSRENTLEIIWAIPGSYTLCVDVANYCSALEDAPSANCLVVEVLEDLPVSIDGATSLCSGMEILLDAGAGFSDYLWSTGQQTATIVVSAPGVYAVTVTSSAGCVGSASLLVESLPDPVPDAGSNAPVCEGESLYLSAAPGFTYLWEGPDGFASDLQYPELAAVMMMQSGWYRLTVRDNLGCEGVDSVFVPVYALPLVEVFVLEEQCADSCDGRITLEPEEFGYSYAWSDGEITAVRNGLCPGMYAVTISGQGGCATIESILVQEGVPIELELVQLQNQLVAEVSGGTPPYVYLWSNGETTPSVPALPGWIAVTVTDAHGCPQTAELLITNLEEGLSSAAGMTLYPNPAEDELFLEWLDARADSSPLDYQVFTLQGVLQQAGRWMPGENRHRLSTIGWSAGSYILVIHTPEGKRVPLRFLIQR